jgi:colanic acid biosynthesis glycosyl transferase WcaI
MNIAIVCQYFPPEFTPIGFMLSELATDLAKAGHRVTVLTGFPNHPFGIVFDGYEKKLFLREQGDGYEIIRCFLYTSPHRTSASRVLNYLSFSFSSLLGLLRLKDQDVVFVVSPPLTNGILGLLAKKIRHWKYVFNVQDIYPDVAISTGAISNGLLISILKRLERAIYYHAAAVTVISEGFHSNLSQKEVDPAKLAVINNWIDTGEVVPMDKGNPFARASQLDNAFVVLYSGTIGVISGAGVLIDCAEALKEYRDILFVFVGEGVEKEQIERDAVDRKLSNMKFLPLQERSRLSEVQSCADVSVVTLRRGKGMTSVPSKVLGYMAAGRPVIASVDAGSDTARLIEAARCGITVLPENPEALCTAILSLYGDRGRARSLGNNGRDYLLAHYGRAVLTSCYERLFRECCAEGAA